jgi:hypothetical protein
MILVVVGMVALLGMAGLALDVGHATLNKTRLQNAVDAAALSGAKDLILTGGDTLQARGAAMFAFGENGDAAGNSELGEAYSDGTINLEVQFSSTLNPFVPGTAPADYIRVRARNFAMESWFARIVGATGKTVAATAVAGPSPTINTACNIAPMMVCGDPAAGAPYWGYAKGTPDVLKMASNGSEIGPGNFQTIRLGDNQGGDDLRYALAGDYDGCASVGEAVQTEPGNSVGPVVQGINTRFGIYTGPMAGKESLYPSDVITEQPDPPITYDRDTDIMMQDSTQLITEEDLTYGYTNYTDSLYTHNFDEPPPIGHYLRREVALPIGDCSETTNGAGTVPVLGFGCYFLLQEAVQSGGPGGNESYVYGQFIDHCNAGGVPGPAPGDGPGLYVIQLYKDPDSPDA